MQDATIRSAPAVEPTGVTERAISWVHRAAVWGEGPPAAHRLRVWADHDRALAADGGGTRRRLAEAGRAAAAHLCHRVLDRCAGADAGLWAVASVLAVVVVGMASGTYSSAAPGLVVHLLLACALGLGAIARPGRLPSAVAVGATGSSLVHAAAVLAAVPPSATGEATTLASRAGLEVLGLGVIGVVACAVASAAVVTRLVPLTGSAAVAAVERAGDLVRAGVAVGIGLAVGAAGRALVDDATTTARADVAAAVVVTTIGVAALVSLPRLGEPVPPRELSRLGEQGSGPRPVS